MEKDRDCIVCGKQIKAKNPMMINYDNAYGECIALKKPEGREEGADYGLQYIGSDCAKKFPKSWIIRSE